MVSKKRKGHAVSLLLGGTTKGVQVSADDIELSRDGSSCHERRQRARKACDRLSQSGGEECSSDSVKSQQTK